MSFKIWPEKYTQKPIICSEFGRWIAPPVQVNASDSIGENPTIFVGKPHRYRAEVKTLEVDVRDLARLGKDNLIDQELPSHYPYKVDKSSGWRYWLDAFLYGESVARLKNRIRTGESTFTPHTQRMLGL
jgi:hypothetical protein